MVYGGFTSLKACPQRFAPTTTIFSHQIGEIQPRAFLSDDVIPEQIIQNALETGLRNITVD